jgi:hypothetical protein
MEVAGVAFGFVGTNRSVVLALGAKLASFGKCSCFWAVNLGDLTSAILRCLV